MDNANNDSTLFGILAVQLAAEEEKVGFIRREFRVTNSKVRRTFKIYCFDSIVKPRRKSHFLDYIFKSVAVIKMSIENYVAIKYLAPIFQGNNLSSVYKKSS